MEEGQLQSDTQHPPQDEAPRKGDQSSAQAQLQTSTPAKAAASSSSSSSCLDQEEAQISIQEKGNLSAQIQAKPLWKPIPPLLPETHTETRDQSCQTEEQLQPTSTSGHGHSTGGGKCTSLCSALASFHPPTDLNGLLASLPELQSRAGCRN